MATGVLVLSQLTSVANCPLDRPPVRGRQRGAPGASVRAAKRRRGAGGAGSRRLWAVGVATVGLPACPEAAQPVARRPLPARSRFHASSPSSADAPPTTLG